METTQPSQDDVLKQILDTVHSVQHDHKQLSTVVQHIQKRLDAEIEHRPSQHLMTESDQNARSVQRALEKKHDSAKASPAMNPSASPSLLSLDGTKGLGISGKPASPQRGMAPGLSSRIILTTYPGQSGIDPLVMNWGHANPSQRGPVVVSRSQSTIRRRNGMQLFNHGACLE